jgi:DNA-binding MurR/RpiR family transcriptional regulator
MGLPDLSVAERVAQVLPALSAAHQRLADYVLAKPFKVAMMTIDELAGACQVSNATANRFVRKLGLPGYSQFRALLAQGFEQALAPVERLRIEQRSRSASSIDIFAASLYEDQRNFELTRQTLGAQQCEKAVEAVLRARRIFVLGFGSSGYLAGLLQRNLAVHCDTVCSLAALGGTVEAARQVARLRKGDLLIVISFPRYLADTVALTQTAQSTGIEVLVITDKPSSPVAHCASICLYAHSQRQYLSNSETAVLGMVEALSAAVAHRCRNPLQDVAQLTQTIMPWLIHGDGNHA